MTELKWHDYKYYPYERDLAAREVATMLGTNIDVSSNVLTLPENVDRKAAEKLTYFASRLANGKATATVQALLENSAGLGEKRQATRYSVHGLHEYKGKFNPQVARVLLNIFGIGHGNMVLDPFCGSGTTMIEALQLGIDAHGIDVNPMAVYVARAKIAALRTPAAEMEAKLDKCIVELKKPATVMQKQVEDARLTYLEKWFNKPELELVERLKRTVEQIAGSSAPVLLTVASDLLRDYSLQEPQDLRIRRRKTPMPEEPLFEKWERDCRSRLRRIAAAQELLPSKLPAATVTLGGAEAAHLSDGGLFDAAITSPPYAMALPYIDTQRLSLVWLGLANPRRLGELEATLIGSRETRGSQRRELVKSLTSNNAALPAAEVALCRELGAALSNDDGFRRQAVPGLLYRYFVGMSQAMKGVAKVMKPDAPFALIVGHNQTTLGGTHFKIDTPRHLANLAKVAGWQVEELIPLQTYKRYGLHASNAVNGETLVILRASRS